MVQTPRLSPRLELHSVVIGPHCVSIVIFHNGSLTNNFLHIQSMFAVLGNRKIITVL